ncbi:BTAD domain-containing putative transcriptional regulator [Nonomuraea sp. NPDC000554]|uniref:BTAD domain-containing putative transcriptional regulator n=1 Tax=Nonomuraea sp. NPDC000554 TaxID=3154259 RepID=UPI0033186CF1
MRFGVLGPLAVWADGGEPVPIPGAKVRALLAVLLMHDGRPVPADRLIDDLWGDDPPGNPPGALSAKVSQLRRALEDAEPGARGLVRSHPAGYVLQVEPDAVDARRFETLLARAGQADAALLAGALAQWRGAAYADFADEPFARAAIAHLEERRLAAQEDLAEARLALGEHGPLVSELGRLVAEHPLRERLRAAHMRALYRTGRQSEALDSYADLRARLADELGLDPGPGLTALHQAILTQDPALAGPSGRPRTNLPALLTGLIGRDTAVAEVRAHLAADRLVTLTGPGGVGKTRLALETATQLAGTFPDGVWLVELAGTPGGAVELVEVVMAALEIQDGGGRAEERLVAALRARRLLLVLDNCEHLVEQAAELVELLLKGAPDLRVLATSREPLAVAGEVVWSVPPLEVPGPGADPATLGEYGAVRLFTARASAAARDFTLDARTAGDVATLCRRLDGIPLALELAATRVRALGVDGLVARLDDRFRLLATGYRGAPPRQQTLTAMIDWSWGLLTGPERLALRRLAVHADGCSLAAAESVCADADLPAADVLDLLARLVDRSLVVAVHGPGGVRYRLLESVAAYCAERMHEAGEYEQVRRRHHAYYTDLAERADPHLRGPEQREWLRRLDAESANLRAALDGAVADGDAGLALRLTSALAWFWFLRGRLTEARRSLDAALALTGSPGDAAVRARAAAWQEGIAVLQGDRTERAALRSFEGAGDPVGEAMAAWFLAYGQLDAGELASADELLQRALAAFEAAGDRWGIAATLVTRTKLAHIRGDLETLERDGERGAELFAALGDRWGELQAAAWLGALAEMTGDHERAVRLHTDGLRLAEELGLWPEVAGRLAWLGWLALQLGDHVQARDLCERGRRLAAEQGLRPAEIFAEMGLAFAARKGGDLDTAQALLRRMLESNPWQDGEQIPPHLPMITIELGFTAELRGDPASALALHRRAFAMACELDAPRGQALAMEGLAGAVSLAGDPARAARLLGTAAAVRDAALLPLGPDQRDDVDRITGRVSAALGQDAFAAEYETGRKLTPHDHAQPS